MLFSKLKNQKEKFVAIFFVLFLALVFVGTGIRGQVAVRQGTDDDKSTVLIVNRVLRTLKFEYVSEIDERKLLNESLKELEREVKQAKGSVAVSSLRGEDSNAVLQQYDAQFLDILEKYGDKIGSQKLLKAAMKGLLKPLDDNYTVYLDSKEHRTLNEQMSGGNFGGIGIYIELDKKNKNQLTVFEPIEDTPAYKAGLKSGDVITAIDGKSTRGISIDVAQSTIRGKIDTKVVLTIRRKGVQKDLSFTLTRAWIHVNSVSYKPLEGGTAYIKLKLFGEETNRELDDALQKAETQGAKGVILDLRNNGGGYITAARDVCSKFLQPGDTVVSVVTRDGRRQTYRAAGAAQLQGRPLVVLVNEYSASASEITAGAIQDYHVGTLIGVKTFGKGSVQTIHPLPNGGAIKLTTAKYFTPKGRDINKKGIQPDVVVPLDPKKVRKLGGDDDLQLKSAVSYIRKLTADR
ncbi:MAG: S41 family peptidase [Armatimonadetes bacterium]|nr:S41 family peptidase [Armatimonadota bacterium]